MRHLNAKIAMAVVLLIFGVAMPAEAASGLGGSTEGDGLHLRVDWGSVGGGWVVGGESVDWWVVAEYDHRLIGGRLYGGVDWRAYDGPRYRLHLWGEAGPVVGTRTYPSAGATAEVGVRNAFGEKVIQWSAGGAFETAAMFSGAAGTSLRYTPAATAAIGIEHAAENLWPDATWLRGTLGYDIRPAVPGAVHVDLALVVRWGSGD
jgi:hypothetical protein